MHSVYENSGSELKYRDKPSVALNQSHDSNKSHPPQTYSCLKGNHLGPSVALALQPQLVCGWRRRHMERVGRNFLLDPHCGTRRGAGRDRRLVLCIDLLTKLIRDRATIFIRECYSYAWFTRQSTVARGSSLRCQRRYERSCRRARVRGNPRGANALKLI